MSAQFKPSFLPNNSINVVHSSYRYRRLVISASNNRRRERESGRGSNREVPQSGESAPDESLFDTGTESADEPVKSTNSLYEIDSLSKDRVSVKITGKDTIRTEGMEVEDIFEGVFFSPLNTLLSVDYLLLFGVDGVLPEIINGRCAMIGILSGFTNEIMMKKSLTEQLLFNVTHGVTPVIAVTVILLSLMPSFLIDQNEYLQESGSRNDQIAQKWCGQGAFRYKFDDRFRGKRAYAVDPAMSDLKIFQMKTPLGDIGFVPFAEVVNARFAMFTLMGTFLIEGFLGHGILSS